MADITKDSDSLPRCSTVNGANLHGSLVAIVTPMKNNTNEVDIPALEKLVDWHITEGTDGIVAVGTTGESPTLDNNEWEDVVKTCVRVARKRVPVIVGSGTNNTKQSIAKTKKAQELGADAAMLVTPYYNKPSQEGLYSHFKAIADAVPTFPIILYNVPSRTVTSILPETTARLAKISNIVGIKDASSRIKELLIDGSADHLCNGFKILSGEDALACDAMLAGAHGVISVAANVFPKLYAEMCRAATTGNKKEALMLNSRLNPIFDVLFIEPSPSVPKYFLANMKKIEEGIRLPLLKLTEDGRLKANEAYLVVEDSQTKI